MPCRIRHIVWALWASVLAGALLGPAVAAPAAIGGRHMAAAWVDPNATQTSNPIDPALSSAVQDLPLDEPPLVRRSPSCRPSYRACLVGRPPAMDPMPQARTATGWEPEGVHLTLWGSDAVLVSWQTGGEWGSADAWSCLKFLLDEHQLAEAV